MAVGAAKGLGNTVYGLGKLVHDYTPVGRISDAIQPGAFDQRPPELEPTNTPQKVGFAGEQIAEFFTPTGAAGKVAKAAEVGKAGLLSMAQSGSPVAAGASAALTAVLPGAGAAKKAASALEEGAKATASRVGSELTAAYKTAAAAGETVPSAIVTGHLGIAADALKMPTASGASAVIPGTERVVKQLDKLKDFVETLGPDIPVDRAATLKRTWDHIVSKAGLFGPKATSTATDSADAWALREAAGSFREILNTNPTIAALNQESAFWTGLRNVLRETEKRTQAQSGGLVAAGMGGSGAVIGALSGDSAGDRATKAVLGGLAGRQMVKLLQSPAFRTQVSAPVKQQLAEALASNKAGRVISVASRILSSLPAEARQLASE